MSEPKKVPLCELCNFREPSTVSLALPGATPLCSRCHRLVTNAPTLREIVELQRHTTGWLVPLSTMVRILGEVVGELDARLERLEDKCE